jgi:hypothetical protein
MEMDQRCVYCADPVATVAGRLVDQDGHPNCPDGGGHSLRRPVRHQAGCWPDDCSCGVADAYREHCDGLAEQIAAGL